LTKVPTEQKRPAERRGPVRDAVDGKEVVEVTAYCHECFEKVRQCTRNFVEKMRRLFSRSGTGKEPENKPVTKQNLRTG